MTSPRGRGAGDGVSVRQVSGQGVLVAAAIRAALALQVAEQSEAKASAETSSGLPVLKTQGEERNRQLSVHFFWVFF